VPVKDAVEMRARLEEIAEQSRDREVCPNCYSSECATAITTYCDPDARVCVTGY
jgi:hypothetical protein